MKKIANVSNDLDDVLDVAEIEVRRGKRDTKPGDEGHDQQHQRNTQSCVGAGRTPANASTMTSGMVATSMSNSADSTADTGNTIRGQLILVSRLALLVRLLVAKRMPPTMNAHGSDFTQTAASVSSVNGRARQLAHAKLHEQAGRNDEAGHQHRPQQPHHRLLVLDLDVAPGDHEKQVGDQSQAAAGGPASGRSR